MREGVHGGAYKAKMIMSPHALVHVVQDGGVNECLRLQREIVICITPRGKSAVKHSLKTATTVLPNIVNIHLDRTQSISPRDNTGKSYPSTG